MLRTCRKCHEEKPVTEFYRKKDGLQPNCKTCVDEYQKATRASWSPERREAQKLYAREYQRRTAKDRNAKRHGLTLEEYEEIIEAQEGACLACETKLGELRHTAIDHNHRHCPGDRGCRECVRGILCSNCNLALGHVKDDPERLLMLYDYLVGADSPFNLMSTLRHIHKD